MNDEQRGILSAKELAAVAGLKSLGLGPEDGPPCPARTGLTKSRRIPEPLLLNIEDVANMFQVPVSWIRERLRKDARDRIPGFKLGKYWRFRREEILAWLNQRSA